VQSVGAACSHARCVRACTGDRHRKRALQTPAHDTADSHAACLTPPSPVPDIHPAYTAAQVLPSLKSIAQQTGSATGATARAAGRAAGRPAAGAGLLLAAGTKLRMMHLQKGHAAAPSGQRSHMSRAHSAAAAAKNSSSSMYVSTYTARNRHAPHTNMHFSSTTAAAAHSNLSLLRLCTHHTWCARRG
jgi:hypothetical protein